MTRIYRGLILIGIIILLLALVFSTPILTTSTDFSILNPDWNGCSNLAVKVYATGKLTAPFYVQAVGTEISVSFQSITNFNPDPRNSTILIIGPTLTFTNEELNYTRNFVRKGGKVLIADDFGTADDLLAGIGAKTRISMHPLLDLAFDKSARYPVIYNFIPVHPVTQKISRVVMNHPSSIVVSNISIEQNQTQVLAWSSIGSWLDKNYNMKRDDDEPSGPFPVLVSEKLGDGEVLLLSDPDVFTNGMIKYPDNEQLRDNMLMYLTKNRTVILIEESHRKILSPYKILFILGRTQNVKWIVVIGAIAVIIMMIRSVFAACGRWIFVQFYRLLLRRKPVEKQRIISVVCARHPDWNRKILIRLVNTLKRSG